MAREFHVGDWLIEPELNRITRAGQEKICIEPKVMDVLAFLASRAGDVVSKKEILHAVWPGTFVGDDVLRYSISELRKAFADDARNPRIVGTIARRGYRLIAPVTKKGLVPEAKLSVAILAFADMSHARDQEYFCDGISEEIINNLTHMSDLRVVSRTSSFAFKGKSEDIRAIGKTLGVTAVLEGSLRKAGNQMRITVQLINVEDGYHLWSDRYDLEIKDIFAIQDEIARSVAAALKIKLIPPREGAVMRVPTTDLQAYDYYLRGRQFFYRYNRKGIECALRMFTQAIELDATFVRAHAGIADCCSFLYMYAGSHEQHRRQADLASSQALELDSKSAEGQASRAVALSLSGSYPEAERAFETAIRLDPSLFEAYYFYARVSFAQGKLEKSIELYEKSSEASPYDYQAPLLVAQIYSDLGRQEEAKSARRRGIQIAETRLKLNPDDARGLYMGANGLVALGETEKGLEWARQALALDPDEPMVLYNVACIQCLAGRTEEALDSLEKAVKNGLTQKDWLEHDSNLDFLRNHVRYHNLIQLLDRQRTAS